MNTPPREETGWHIAVTRRAERTVDELGIECSPVADSSSIRCEEIDGIFFQAKSRRNFGMRIQEPDK